MRIAVCLASLLIFIQHSFLDGNPSTNDVALEEYVRDSACQGYERDFIELIEMIYGKGFLSQGGRESVQSLFGDRDLDGLNVLDIGSGLGGPSLYLAEKHCANIIGLEPQKWMVEIANKNLVQAHVDLKGSVEFVYMNAASNLMQFSDDSFDVVFSKESLLHIPREVKANFFSEIYRVLKPDGTIIIMDWLHKTSDYSENTRKMIELDGVAYNLITLEDYLDILEKTGFIDIACEDETLEHAKLSQQNIDTIIQLKSTIEDKYGEEVYKSALESWGWQRDAFLSRELLTNVFVAKK